MRVSVIGGGLMGSGISEVCARAGLDVTVIESDDERAAEKEVGRIHRPNEPIFLASMVLNL